MDIKELLDLVEEKQTLKEEMVDPQMLNNCIDILYSLEEIALDQDDTNAAQFLKDARIYCENYRSDLILNMTDENGEF